MATKTISIDLEAYERLRRARVSQRESFSKVIKRAVWPTPSRSAARILAALDELPPVSEEVLERLERAQREDQPPEDPWRDG